jgi:hypothetical protein|tara:strand:+ start:297 stop:596 length:300 start_codon:yes stop_codon:yes gene_type:complete
MKSLNQFIEEAANSVKKKEEEKIPKCPEGQYYDPKLKRCMVMPPKYGGRFWGGTFHKPNGNNGNGHSNGNGNGSNGNGTPANGNGSNGHGNGGGNGSNG